MTEFREIERHDGHLPLADYGVVSDGRTTALVGADGSIDWWCVPAPHRPPALDRLLDLQSGGRFAIEPSEPYRVRRRYRDRSNVLETEFETAGGRVRVTDSLNSGHAGRLPWSELARRIEGLEGEVPLTLTLQLGGRFEGQQPRGCVAPNDGSFQLGPLLLQLRTTEDCVVDGADGEPDGRGYTAELTTHEGSRSTLALLATERAPLMDSAIEDIDRRIDRSDEQWRNWASDLTYEGPHTERVVRSALALKLLLHSPTGAIAAAATTSLPEGIGGAKNWDYRFAWVRDQAYSVKALLRVGGLEEAQAGFTWLIETIDRHLPELRVFYTLDGEMPGPEQELDDVPGYRGSTPVRSGNRARDQRQLSCYGDVLEMAELFVRSGNHLDDRTGRVLAELADRCCEEWQLEDAGIWELQQDRQYTMSKIGCWMALDRAATLADRGCVPDAHAERWRSEADAILAWIDEHCWSEEREAYVQYAGGDALDAAILLAVRFGLPRPERLDATRRAVEDELARGALVYRYSGVESEEGAFLACSFWLVEALALLGHRERAAEVMDELLEATAGDLGVVSEMVDPETGAFLGNLPQGLTHLALIHAALSLREAAEGERDEGRAGDPQPGHPASGSEPTTSPVSAS